MSAVKDGRYYHAGYARARDGEVVWSNHTRYTRQAAVREAQRMARNADGRPVVEYWDRQHGRRPGDCELVAGADFVDGDAR